MWSWRGWGSLAWLSSLSVLSLAVLSLSMFSFSWLSSWMAMGLRSAIGRSSVSVTLVDNLLSFLTGGRNCGDSDSNQGRESENDGGDLHGEENEL